MELKLNSAVETYSRLFILYVTVPISKQPAILCFRNAVRVSRARFQFSTVHDRDRAARRRDQSAFDQHVKRLRDPGTTHTEHQRQKLMGEMDCGSRSPIVRHQNPAGQSLLDAAVRIRDCGLRGLHDEGMHELERDLLDAGASGNAL